MTNETLAKAKSIEKQIDDCKRFVRALKSYSPDSFKSIDISGRTPSKGLGLGDKIICPLKLEQPVIEALIVSQIDLYEMEIKELEKQLLEL